MSGNLKVGKRSVVAWCFYDFANSAFFTIVTTFIFAAYFARNVAANPIVGTHQWGNAIALAGLIIAVVSPIVGAIADLDGQRKVWLGGFTLLAIVGCCLLWLAKPDPAYVNITLFSLVIATVGVEVGMVFYNSLLPGLVSPNYLGRMSGWGWGFGYVGGLLALIVALLGLVKAGYGWLDHTTLEQVRICGPFAGLWLAVFATPLFIFVSDRRTSPLPLSQAIRLGLKQLGQTLRQLPKYANIMVFLIGRMIYTDGLNTLFAFGGIYAAGTFHMNVDEVILFGITLNITAGLGAGAFAWIDDWLGPKKTILLSLVGLIVITTSVLMVQHKLIFWVLAAILAIFVGPVQAASRTLMARLAPAGMVTEFFGLYALSGKATAFMAPWLLGWLTLQFKSQRMGMAIVLLFFVVGGALLLRVRVPE